MPEDRKLQKVNLLGSRYFFRFLDDKGNMMKVEVPEAEFRKLLVKDCPRPALPEGAVIFDSAGDEIWVDTPSGNLEKNQYVVMGDYCVVSLEENEKDYPVLVEKIESDSLKADSILTK